MINLNAFFNGDSANSLTAYVPVAILIGFGLIPMLIGSGMVCRVYERLRADAVSGNASASTRAMLEAAYSAIPPFIAPFLKIKRCTPWMTLKWRCIMAGISIATLCFFNHHCSSELADAFRRYEEFLPVYFNSNFLWGWDTVSLFLFFIIVPAFVVFMPLKAMFEILCSHNIIKKTTYVYRKLNGKRGYCHFIAHTPFAFALVFLITGSIGKGTFFFQPIDLLVACNVYFFVNFLWIFVKTDWDFKNYFKVESGKMKKSEYR